MLAKHIDLMTFGTEIWEFQGIPYEGLLFETSNAKILNFPNKTIPL